MGRSFIDGWIFAGTAPWNQFNFGAIADTLVSKLKVCRSAVRPISAVQAAWTITGKRTVRLANSGGGVRPQCRR